MDGNTELTGRWKNVLKLIIPYFIIVGSFQLIGILVLGLSLKDLGKGLPAGPALVMMLFNAAGTFFVVWLLRKYLDKGTFSSLGLKTIPAIDIVFGLLMGFFIMLAGYLILIAAHQITYLNNSFQIGDFTLNFLFFILVAFTEELLMRGYVLTNLMASMNKYTALVVSSAVFSLMHLANADYGWFAAFELFMAGILLGLSYIYTRNLWFPVALHFSWNFFQGAIFGFNVSGLHFYSVITHVRYEDNIWNGGAFGFEGSLLSLFLQIIAIAIIYLVFSKRNIMAQLNDGINNALER